MEIEIINIEKKLSVDEHGLYSDIFIAVAVKIPTPVKEINVTIGWQA